MHGREKEVLDMIRTHTFVQQNVPVSPTNRAVVEVVNHRPPILLTKLPLSDSLRIECIDTALGEDQMLLRKDLVNQTDVVEHRIAATPRLVPVITDAPDRLRRLRIGKEGTDSLIDQIAIVIPGDDLLITQPRTAHRWPEIILEEVSFFLGGVNTRLPFLRRHRFVLNRESPDG